MQLTITNCSKDHVYLDTACNGFESPDTRVVTKPCAVAPGLSRPISVLFTVQPGDRAALGTVQIFVASMRTGLGLVYDVPMHYRVGPSRPATDNFLCTLENFDLVRSKYVGCEGVTPHPRGAYLVRTYDFHRLNEEKKDQTARYDITRFPKIGEGGAVSATETYSTIFSSRAWDGT